VRADEPPRGQPEIATHCGTVNTSVEVLGADLVLVWGHADAIVDVRRRASVTPIG